MRHLFHLVAVPQANWELPSWAHSSSYSLVFSGHCGARACMSWAEGCSITCVAFSRSGDRRTWEESHSDLSCAPLALVQEENEQCWEDSLDMDYSLRKLEALPVCAVGPVFIQ